MSPFEKGWNKKGIQEPVETPIVESKEVEKIVEKAKEPLKEVKAESNTQTFVVKTELDAYINELLINQPKSIEEIKVKSVDDYDFMASHVLVLPKEIETALKSKNMVPRWINKKKRAIDHAINQRGWTIFNRAIFPKIAKHNFTANGTVEVGDCILAFMPAQNAEFLRKIPGEKSQERVKNLPIEAYKNAKGDEEIGYYKPAISAEPDGVVERQGMGLYAQPDVPNQNE